MDMRTTLINLILGLLSGLGLLAAYIFLVCITGGSLILIALVLLAPPISFLVDIRYRARLDPGDVSGFYGPGAFLAWVCSVGYTIFTFLDDDRHLPRSKGHLISPDALSFMATYVYTAIAAIDALIRLLRGSNHDTDAQLAAALMVCRYALLATGAACFVSNLDSANLWPWRALAILNATPVIIDAFRACLAWTRIYQGLVTLSVIACTFLTESSWFAYYMFCMICAVLGSIFMQVRDACGDPDDPVQSVEVALAWPHSSSGWLDLDQLAALGAGVVALLVGLVARSEKAKKLIKKGRKRIRKLIRWRRGTTSPLVDSEDSDTAEEETLLTVP